MKVTVFPHPLSGALEAVRSKSYAHRILIAAALSGGQVAFGDSEDARLTATALCALGFKAKFAENSVCYGGFCRPDERQEVTVGESGSTLRFLLPLAAALGVEAEFITAGRLSERPMDAVTKTLSMHGAVATAHSVKGQLTPGRYEIDATVSSQFVTGLLMALPLLDGDSEIALLGRAVSAPYIEITLDVLARAGVSAERTDGGFLIRGGQKYNLKNAQVPGDFSGAAFPLVAGALGGKTTLSGLDLSDKQGDKAILTALSDAGAKVMLSETVSAEKDALTAFTADVGETPDLAPILAVLAAYCKGESTLKKVSRLKDKESDRLFAIEEMLSRAGISSREEGDTLVITGGKPQGAAFRSFSDHRMAMAEAILAAYATGQSEIDDMTCVKKSYPGFWKDFAALGGQYEMERR